MPLPKEANKATSATIATKFAILSFFDFFTVFPVIQKSSCLRTQKNKNDHVGSLGELLTGIARWNYEKSDADIIEELYQALEFVLYEKKLTLRDIFCYTVDQTNQIAETKMFFRWIHYLHLCDKLGWVNYLPERFITSYNEALEKCGLLPIIYKIDYITGNEIYWRSNTIIEFDGIFPCDRNGEPIMKWIGLRIKNPGEITCSQKRSKHGRLYVELRPDTTIHAFDCYDSSEENEAKVDENDNWYQIYAGPLTMEFWYPILKLRRNALKFTQKQVADAVGATVRTYQKWENGESTPDGHYLLRLINWLNIENIQDLVKYIG
jgi:DNA-binding XRE family transcriptional regulator